MVENQRGFNEVRFEFKAGQHEFNVINFIIDEGFSTPFCGTFKLSSRQRQIHAEDMMNMTGTLKVYQNKKLTRIFSGIIQRFEKGDDTGIETRYNLTIVPAFARFALRHNSRIFQHKSVIDILEEMLKEFRITNYYLRITNQHEKRDYCVQYRETDLEFLHRILAEEGIAYFFEYDEAEHTIVFNDYTPKSVTAVSDVLYDPKASAMPDQPYIWKFLLQNALKPTNAVLADYNFQTPKFTMNRDATTYETEIQNGQYEYYDYPARYLNGDVGTLFSKSRIHYLRRDSSTALGESSLAQFLPGTYFELKGEYLKAYNRKWVLTQVRHIGEQAQSLEERSSTGKTTYRNEFSVMPLNLLWSPTPEPKPQVGGPNVAVVVGPPGEEIYVDRFGRVKVLFKWDRYQHPEPSNDSERTCWIRVSDGWAGSGRGTMAIPRVGDEVLVSFLEGDPDRPIITGRTYNGHNLHPFALPEQKTITGIKTKTYRGEGYNELQFDDATDNELIHLHAQKNMDTKVLNDQTTYVIHDHSERIGNDQTILVEHDQKIDVLRHEKETVGGNQTLTVKRNQVETVFLGKLESIGIAKSLNIGSSYLENVGATKNTHVGLQYTIHTGQRMKISTGKTRIDVAGETSIVEAGKHLELRCGKSQIVMTEDGNIYLKGMNIHIQAESNIYQDGVMINLNTGASEAPPSTPEDEEIENKDDSYFDS